MFRVNHNRTEAYEPLPAIFPGHVAPVVRQCHYGERDLATSALASAARAAR